MLKMLTNFIAVFLFFCLTNFKEANSQACSEDVSEWVPVPENAYDRNISSIQNPNGRPLGYARDTLFYVDQALPNPCVHLSGASDRRVEIMAESSPAGSTLCARDQENTIGCYDKIYQCGQAVADDLYVEFFCEGSSCEATDVTFFYRITVSPPDTEIDPETWCANRNTGEYPSSLIGPQLPPGVSVAPMRTTKTSMASTTKAVTLTIVMLALLSMLRNVL